jgi:hypothetical protein
MPGSDDATWLPGLEPVVAAITLRCPADALAIKQSLLLYSRRLMCGASVGVARFNSPLMPGGYPLEFAFRTGIQAICYTGGPGLPDCWAFVEEATSGFNAESHPLIYHLSMQPGQRFGCWLSTRHKNSQTHQKIYQEVRTEADPVIEDWLASRLNGLNFAMLAPMLVGMNVVDSEPTEFYFRILDNTPHNLQTLFNVAGKAPSSLLPFVLCCLSDLASEQQSTLLPRLRLGVSYRLQGDKPPQITLFAHAAQLFKSNLIARAKIISMARQFDDDFSLYADLTRSTVSAPSAPPLHSMVHFVFGPGRHASFGVGWRPPESCVPCHQEKGQVETP